MARLKNLLVAAAFAGSSLAGANAMAEEVRVLNWQGYGTDEAWAIELFEEQTGYTVVHDNFNSEQEMLTKLRTSPGAYDVVLINSAFTQQAAEEGLIQPIDSSKISNFADLSPGLRDASEFTYDGALYGIAWTWGVTSIAYDTDEVDPGNSIDILWDPAYAGRVGIRDDAVENVYLAALATGQNMNDPQDMESIREKLRELKPQIRTFWSSEDEWNKEFSADSFDVAIYWSGSALAQRQGVWSADRFPDPRRRRHQLARRPVDRDRRAQFGRCLQVHRLHGEPRALRALGHRSRRAGLGQRCCHEPAAGRRLQPPGSGRPRSDQEPPVHGAAERRQA